MLKLHKDKPAEKQPDRLHRIERQIQATDKEIDALVYELYGLSEDEIKIVEGEILLHYAHSTLCKSKNIVRVPCILSNFSSLPVSSTNWNPSFS